MVNCKVATSFKRGGKFTMIYDLAVAVAFFAGALIGIPIGIVLGEASRKLNPTQESSVVHE